MPDVFLVMKVLSERDKVAHLLRRFGLGASEAEIDFYLGNGSYQDAVKRLLNYEDLPDKSIPLDIFGNDKGLINMKACQFWWYSNILATERPIEQALTIFWHNHFATSAEKVDAVGAMHTHIETIRQNCLGRFQDLLTAISKDPAMLYWLDNHENKKGKPNENFAREVMELFTLGIGHYSEKDIQEAARAFTGWTYGVERRGRIFETPKPAQRPKLKETDTVPIIAFLNQENQHDSGEKSILGNRGNFDGDDVLGILCGNPRSAMFITEKFLTWFVYPNPEPAFLDRMAKAFRSSGMDIKALCSAVMLSPEFLSDKAIRSIVKNPVAYCVATMRQLGLGNRVYNLSQNSDSKQVGRVGGLPVLLEIASKAMGMDLMYPPDVSGWKYGSNWISSATMVERMKWSEKLFGTFQIGTKNRPTRNASLGINAFDLLEGNTSPQGMVERILSIFDVVLPADKLKQVVSAASNLSEGEVTATNANYVAAGITRLIFGSPEFQFC